MPGKLQCVFFGIVIWKQISQIPYFCSYACHHKLYHWKTVIQNGVLYTAQLNCHHNDGTQIAASGVNHSSIKGLFSAGVQDENTKHTIETC